MKIYIKHKLGIISEYSSSKIEGGNEIEVTEVELNLLQKQYDTFIDGSKIVKQEKGENAIAIEVKLSRPEVFSDEYKQKLILEYKKIEDRAVEKRSEYITAELLPESMLKKLKLEKLEKEKVEIETDFNDKVTDLVTKFGPDILKEIV